MKHMTWSAMAVAALLGLSALQTGCEYFQGEEPEPVEWTLELGYPSGVSQIYLVTDQGTYSLGNQYALFVSWASDVGVNATNANAFHSFSNFFYDLRRGAFDRIEAVQFCYEDVDYDDILTSPDCRTASFYYEGVSQESSGPGLGPIAKFVFFDQGVLASSLSGATEMKFPVDASQLNASISALWP